MCLGKAVVLYARLEEGISKEERLPTVGPAGMTRGLIPVGALITTLGPNARVSIDIGLQ